MARNAAIAATSLAVTRTNPPGIAQQLPDRLHVQRNGKSCGAGVGPDPYTSNMQSPREARNALAYTPVLSSLAPGNCFQLRPMRAFLTSVSLPPRLALLAALVPG